MNTAIIKKFAQSARRMLLEQIDRKLERVLAPAGIYRREKEAAVKELEREIAAVGREQVIKKAAYTWFNRICALRFMDIKGYTRVRTVSPSPGLSQPEILSEAKTGHIDEVLVPEPVRQKVLQLLGRQMSSENPEQEAFSLLFTACCNYYHREMPFLFEKIQDFTELLLPDDLLSENSLLQMTIAALDEANCEKVEVIGWLYQYYISERKDEVFADLKKNKKIQQSDIPAATQLFTPEWIVRYMVENSLGRLWLQNFPASPLQQKMPYYIPDEPGAGSDSQFIKIVSPEEIRFCDPACGSGHILVIAFDLLYQMYEEHGYDATQIPALILQKNLVGLEIDERAAELAAFALSMKAREKDKRFFTRKDSTGNRIRPDILVFSDVKLDDQELEDYVNVVGKDIFTIDLAKTLKQFEQATMFGSLIRPAIHTPGTTLAILEEKGMHNNLHLRTTHQRVEKILIQAKYLAEQYHVVVANPPYMGGKGMNPDLTSYLKKEFSDFKSDLFSAFIVRNTFLAKPFGLLGFMTPFVWMFISSYEKLRLYLVEEKTITSLVQLEYSGFEGATVPICTFTLQNAFIPGYRGGYVRLSEFRGSAIQGPMALEIIKAAKENPG